MERKSFALVAITIILLSSFVFTPSANCSVPLFTNGAKIQANGADLKINEQTNALSTFIVDWNNDGKKDLLLGTYYPSYIYLFLNTGSDSSPVFGSGNKLEFADNGMSINFGSSIFVVDWDNDGKKDVLVAQQGFVYLLKNVGTNTYPQFTSTEVSPILQAGTNIFVVDWNNDGKKDLIVGHDGWNNHAYIDLYINIGTDSSPAFADPTQIVADQAPICRSYGSAPFVVDWNYDGKKDLVVREGPILGQRGPAITYYQNVGTDASPLFSSGVMVKAAGELISVYVGDGAQMFSITDWNNDNIWDIVMGDYDGYVWLYKAIDYQPTYPTQNGVEKTQFCTSAAEYSLTAGVAHSIAQTSDGGYIIAGGKTIHSGTKVVKVDSRGMEQWRKTWDQDCDNIIQTADGGYLIAGTAEISLRKLDSKGNVEWTKNLGVYSNRAFVVQTADGGYAYAGGSFVLVKTDSLGTVQWKKPLVSNQKQATFESMSKTADGGFVLAGNKDGGGWIVKTDSQGNIEWDKTYAREKSYIYSVVQSASGGYAVAGGANLTNPAPGSFYGTAWLASMDSNGIILWDNEFTNDMGCYAREMVRTEEGGYALVGTVGVGAAFWLAKTTVNGNIEFVKTYSDRNQPWFAGWAIVQTSDGGYAITGSSFFLVKTDLEGNTTPQPQTGAGEHFATISDGSAIVNSQEANGIKIVFSGLNAPSDAYLTVTTNYTGATPPLGTGNLQVTGVAFYDVLVKPSVSIGTEGVATISITHPSFYEDTNVFLYWNGQNWVQVESSYISPNTIVGDIPISALWGTPIAIATETTPPSQTPPISDAPSSSPNASYFSNAPLYYCAIGVTTIVAVLIVTVFMRKRRAKNLDPKNKPSSSTRA
jgi:hypothetical protein